MQDRGWLCWFIIHLLSFQSPWVLWYNCVVSPLIFVSNTAHIPVYIVWRCVVLCMFLLCYIVQHIGNWYKNSKKGCSMNNMIQTGLDSAICFMKLFIHSLVGSYPYFGGTFCLQRADCQRYTAASFSFWMYAVMFKQFVICFLYSYILLNFINKSNHCSL
jgi:hypothetical protein